MLPPRRSQEANDLPPHPRTMVAPHAFDHGPTSGAGRWGSGGGADSRASRLQRVAHGRLRVMPRRTARTAPCKSHHSNTYANRSGATIVASLSITNAGVSGESLPQVTFSLGGAPEYPP